MKNNSLLHQLLRLPQLLILVVTYFLIRAASKAPAIVDAAYSSKVYPFIRNAVSSVTRIVPFSVAEVSTIALVLLFSIMLVVRVIRLLCLKRHSLVRLVSLIISAVLTVAWLVFVFYVMWGFNYFRPSVAEKLDLPEKEYTSEQLFAVCMDLSQKASALRESVPESDDGVFTTEVSSLKVSIPRAFADFGATRPSFKADVPQVKPLTFSGVFSKLGISGIYVPFSEEPNINTDEHPLFIPFSAAHETAHYLGYAREEDANFLAFLILKDSSSPELAYSAYMHALVHCANALYKADPEAYKLLSDGYSDAMRADLASYSEHYRKNDSSLREASDKVNDSYLKLNKQEKGVLSYEEDTALILRYYDSCRFFD